MERDITRIARRLLITLSSIVLILVFNAYIKNRYNLQVENVNNTETPDKGDQQRKGAILNAWDDYTPLSVDWRVNGVLTVIEPSVDNESGRPADKEKPIESLK